MNIKRCNTCGMTTNDDTCGKTACLPVPGFARLELKDLSDSIKNKLIEGYSQESEDLFDYKTMADKIEMHSLTKDYVDKKDELNKSTAAKFDSGKPPLSLIPKSALIGAAEVLDMGKAKYSAHNWKKGMQWSRLVDASMRHLLTWNEGESIDQESKKSHIAHAIVNLMFLYEYEEKGLGTDDRYKK